MSKCDVCNQDVGSVELREEYKGVPEDRNELCDGCFIEYRMKLRESKMHL
jgi:hypothetical protein